MTAGQAIVGLLLAAATVGAIGWAYRLDALIARLPHRRPRAAPPAPVDPAALHRAARRARRRAEDADWWLRYVTLDTDSRR